ncbi:MAG: HAMP domain-containing protein [Chloroflexi bacterium]|nr:HAMP domain-containing protein [Chloroflexota bacterium]
MTIRTRLTFLYASLLAIVILVFSAATSSILNWTLRNQVDDNLIQTINDVRVQAYSRVEPAPQSNVAIPEEQTTLQIYSLSSPGLFLQIWKRDESGDIVPMWRSQSLQLAGYSAPLDEEALQVNTERRSDQVVDNTHMRVVTVPLTGQNGELYGHIQAAQSLHTVDAAIDRLLKIMLIGGAIALLASLLLGDLLTRRALLPIDTIAQAAQQITAADDLSRRIPYDGPPDELAQLTSTFNDTLERLERLFKAQRRFVADVSHEMRTPLTTIQGNIDLMHRFGFDEEAVDAIESESKRMSRLVGDLLLLARADAGRLSLEKEAVELDTLVLEVYNQAHMLSKGVEVQLGSIDRAHVMGDADRLKQLLLNLVSNGLKYTPEGGTVILNMQRDHHWVYVQISDTGIGIPEDDLPHIFDRFYRVDKARSRAQGGTGLGLSIARWVADAHGGQLTVNSQVGVGSTFTVILPLIPDGQTALDSMSDTQPNLRVARAPRSR